MKIFVGEFVAECAGSIPGSAIPVVRVRVRVTDVRGPQGPCEWSLDPNGIESR